MSSSVDNPRKGFVANFSKIQDEEEFQDALHAALDDVAAELLEAAKKFPPFNSPHEGHSVIQEEFEELWDEVKRNRGRSRFARDEAMQLAAMAVRYMIDLCETPDVDTVH